MRCELRGLSGLKFGIGFQVPQIRDKFSNIRKWNDGSTFHRIQDGPYFGRWLWHAPARLLWPAFEKNRSRIESVCCRGLAGSIPGSGDEAFLAVLAA